MAFEFRLPDIGEGVIEGEVVRWMVKEGDLIREDQPMVEVMTDKATVEIPSPRAGRVARIAAPEGKTCAVGQVMVVIEEVGAVAGETAGHGAATPSLAAEERQALERLPATRAEATSGAHAGGSGGDPRGYDVHAHGDGDAGGDGARAGGSDGDAHAGRGHGPAGGKVLATPATRKLARDLAVDLSRVGGTGPNGRVTAEDVRAASGRPILPAERAPARGAVPAAAPERAASPSAPGRSAPAEEALRPVAPLAPLAPVAGAADERVPFRGVRKKIAENMARSRRTAAHFTYVEEADVTELVALRGRAKKRAEERGVKLSFLPFIVKAVVAGLKKYPIVNSTLDEEKQEIVLRRRYHVGVAAASEAGLIVPVVKDADRKSLFDIARELQELSDKAKAGKATREELTGSTFTISSLGALGGVLATPIINHPEVAILGVHKIKPTPVVRDGQIVIREMTNFSISLDHRVVDGYEGALFLQHVISLLEDPTLMFMELV